MSAPSLLVCPTLSVSLVTYQSNSALLRRTLASLQAAVQGLAPTDQADGWQCSLVVVDNGNTPALLRALLAEFPLLAPHSSQLLSNDHNRGFGAAHNRAIKSQAIKSRQTDYHLILNPDVEMTTTALSTALAYLQQHPEVVALSPHCTNNKGEVEYLCKRYPAVLDLFLRGFAPRWLRQCFAKRLAHYACHDVVASGQSQAVPLLSGCWFLCRTSALQAVGGFDERYFLYFEDFALSQQLSKHGELHYLPTSQIVHHGGYAARKGVRHIGYFLRSAVRFFQQYGWRWL
jgi:GT2 family glycosyltransferase